MRCRPTAEGSNPPLRCAAPARRSGTARCPRPARLLTLPLPLAPAPLPQATIDWEAQEEGYLAKILVPAGSKDIPVGTTVALLVEDAADVAAFDSYTPSGSAAAAPAPAAPKKGKGAKAEAPPAAAAGGPASFPPHQVRAGGPA